MIWYSSTAGSNGLPAVLALGAKLIGRTLRVEALYVNAPLPAGPEIGTFTPGWDASGWQVTVEWPSDMPYSDTGGKIHPVEGWTPARLVAHIDDVDVVSLPVVD